MVNRIYKDKGRNKYQAKPIIHVGDNDRTLCNRIVAWNTYTQDVTGLQPTCNTCLRMKSHKTNNGNKS